MLSQVISATLEGVSGLIVEVEVDIAPGLPSFATVGLPEGAVRESKDRVKAAIKNCGYDFPARKITVNLAPADVRKAGTGYDLPIAIGILSATGVLKGTKHKEYLLIGELSLDGRLRPVPGVLPIAITASKSAITGIIVPAENAQEAAIVEGLDVIAVNTLFEVVEFLEGLKVIEPVVSSFLHDRPASCQYDIDLSEVKGQSQAKRALEIAAAGGHNLLFEGPPGSGKTMIARRLPTILPDLSLEEAIETTSVYSVAGLTDKYQGIIRQRPFRAPHHTISDAGLIGGGQVPRPGEVSLAHNGVLFLDELAEYRKNVLEGLRQPLEDGMVTISRASSSLTFPAEIILVAAVNPCPCGYHGDPAHNCTCSAVQVLKYKSRISGPLVDRIDMYVEVSAVPFSDLTSQTSGESSKVIKERVVAARKIQQKRFQRHKHVYCNSQMGSKAIAKFCALDSTCQQLIENAVNRLGLSARAYNRIQKIARTIADLDNEEDIKSSHVAEAIQYRRLDRSA
nr:YifB family Mg chelatase-like AAA ATPase [Desulfobulbaceae bacterium]